MPTSPAQSHSGTSSGAGDEAFGAANESDCRTWWSVALGAVIVLAAVLRLIDLGAKSVWSDEAFSIFIAKQNWAGFWRLTSTAEANMSLYYLLLRGWIHLGDGAWWVRLLSAVFSIAAVPVVYWIGKEVFSRQAGLVAALLLAINPFDIRYAQEARSYSLFVLLVSVSFLAFFCSLQKPNRLWSVCYVLSTCLALYAHFFAAFAVLVQLVALAAFPADKQKVAIRQAWRLGGGVIVLGLPLLWFVLRRDSGQLAWAPPVHGRDVYDVFRFLLGSGLKLGIAVAAFFIAATAWIKRYRNERWTMGTWSFLVVVLWLFLPVFLTLLVSVWKPIYAPRFLIFCLPAALLLVSDGISGIRFTWIRYALVLALMVGEIGPVRSYYADAGQEDWKSAVWFLANNAGTGDLAVLPNAYCELPLKYELEHAGGTIHEFRIVSSPSLPELPAGSPGVLWMVTCSATKDANAEATISNYKVEGETRFTGVRITKLGR